MGSALLKRGRGRPLGQAKAMTDTQHKIVKRVAERMKSHPEAHCQEYWYLDPAHSSAPMWDTVHGEYNSRLVINVGEMADCGSVACSAGHIVLAALELGLPLRINPAARGEIDVIARRLVGLPAEQAERLFSAKSDEFARRVIAAAAESGDWSDLQ